MRGLYREAKLYIVHGACGNVLVHNMSVCFCLILYRTTYSSNISDTPTAYDYSLFCVVFTEVFFLAFPSTRFYGRLKTKQVITTKPRVEQKQYTNFFYDDQLCYSSKM